MRIVQSMLMVTCLTVNVGFSSVLMAEDDSEESKSFWQDSSSTSKEDTRSTSKEDNGIQVSWSISKSSGLYHYTYEITDTTGKNLDAKVKEFILKVGESFGSKEFLDSKGEPIRDIILTNNDSSNKEGEDQSKESGDDSKEGNGYYLEKGSEKSTLKFDFYTSRAPVWGRFSTGGEKNSLTFNSGFESASSTSGAQIQSFSSYIVLPGGESLAVPEPATLLIMGSSLAVLYAARRRKRNQDQ